MNTRISTPITILAISCLLAAGSTFAQAENGEGKGDDAEHSERCPF